MMMMVINTMQANTCVNSGASIMQLVLYAYIGLVQVYKRQLGLCIMHHCFNRK